MSSDQPVRPIQHLWTAAQVMAVIVTITGFLPADWLAYVFQSIETRAFFRDSFLSAIDYRLLAVGLGVFAVSHVAGGAGAQRRGPAANTASTPARTRHDPSGA